MDQKAKDELNKNMACVTNMPYGIYEIDRGYLDYLRLFDDKIPFSDYEDHGGKRKFYMGPIKVHDIPFFVPISHQIKYDYQFSCHDYNDNKSILYGAPLTDSIDNNTVIGSIDLRHMVPVVNRNFIKRHEFEKTENGKCNTKSFGYKQSASAYRKKKSDLFKFASTVYDKVTSKINSNAFLKENSVDFDKAIEHGHDYYQKLKVVNYAISKDKPLKDKLSHIAHRFKDIETNDEKAMFADKTKNTSDSVQSMADNIKKNQHVIASAIKDKQDSITVTAIATSCDSPSELSKRFDLIINSPGPSDDDTDSPTTPYP